MNTLITSVRLTLASTLLLGLAWPLAMTGLAQVALPGPASGSLVQLDGRAVGSARVGQAWSDPRYLWGRPSAISTPYDASTSSGSNLGPNNPALREAVRERVEQLQVAHPDAGPVPLDLVTASGSGLDPHITPAAAAWQVRRVASARGLDPARVQAVIDAHTEGRLLGIFGEPRVDVLATNLGLDAL